MRKNIHLHEETCTCRERCKLKHTHIHTCKHTCTRAHTHTHTHARACAHTNKTVTHLNHPPSLPSSIQREVSHASAAEYQRNLHSGRSTSHLYHGNYRQWSKSRTLGDPQLVTRTPSSVERMEAVAKVGHTKQCVQANVLYKTGDCGGQVTVEGR